VSQPATKPATPATADADGVVLECGPLRARVVDHRPRFIHRNDEAVPGLHGLASLLHRDHGKNLYSACGLNYQVSKPVPVRGALAEKGGGPRAAPMRLERTGERSARLFQRGEDCTGLDTTLDYELRETGVDQTITFRPTHDLSGFDAFFASYMNQPQYTALFLRGQLQGDAGFSWYEVDSAGHGGPHGGDRIYYRPFDPVGRSWTQHMRDQPLLRQKIWADESTVAATLAAGFRMNDPNKCRFEGFYYALFDQYVYLHIFREPEFYFWLSCSGGGATRNPAWDYGIRGGSLRAGEERKFHVRLVVKPFAGVDDVLREVEAFRGNGAPACGGFAW
jgi:hypothetical protein